MIFLFLAGNVGGHIKDDEAGRRNWPILWNRIRKQNAPELAASDRIDAAFLPELQPPPGDLWGQSSLAEKLLGDGFCTWMSEIPQAELGIVQLDSLVKLQGEKVTGFRRRPTHSRLRRSREERARDVQTQVLSVRMM